MDRFLKLPTVQKDTYGFVLDAHSSFHLRHRMVQSFLLLQSKRDQFPNKTQRQLASITANSFNRGDHTARMIVQWTNIWMQGENLPNHMLASISITSAGWMMRMLPLLFVNSFISRVKVSVLNPPAPFFNL